MPTVSLSGLKTRQTFSFVPVDDPPAGGVKYVYFSPDRKYVVAFFHDPSSVSPSDRVRLEDLVGGYRSRIFTQDEASFWEKIFCWPLDIVKDPERGIGLVVPVYSPGFFFSRRGRYVRIGDEKKGSTLYCAWGRYGDVDASEWGTWRDYFDISLNLARGVRRMHWAGLTHSDLSNNNVLIDPSSGRAMIIDVDGLVVPGRFRAEVDGTPGFIAPEVVASAGLPPGKRPAPSKARDRFSMAVLIYRYLLCRDPLDGRLVCDRDPARNAVLKAGEKARFIEDPTNRENRFDLTWAKNRTNWRTPDIQPYLAPWYDLDKLPYTVLGAPLASLVKRAFVDGLHAPELRPSANDWESALIRSRDLLLPCENPNCIARWFVFNNSRAPSCPFCGTRYRKPLPILNLFGNRGNGNFQPDDWRVMVFDGIRLYPWHADATLLPNEHLPRDKWDPVLAFQFHQGRWYLRNLALPSLADCSSGDRRVPIPVGGHAEIRDGSRFLLGNTENDRLLIIQMANQP